MTSPVIKEALRSVIGGYAVTSDAWHAPTTPPRVADNAEWFAFTRFALPPYWGMGNGVCTWENYTMPPPPLPVLQAGPYVNFGGRLAGVSRTTALLLSQADAAQRLMVGNGGAPVG